LTTQPQPDLLPEGSPPPAPHGLHFPSVTALHHHLREEILDGRLPAGHVISQQRYASDLGVSRTKLREALRMLENEGLIKSQEYRRSRVTGFEPDTLDSLYAARILLEATAAYITVPKLRSQDAAALRAVHDEMQRSWAAQDLHAWDGHHREFHRLLIAQGPAPMVQSILSQARHAERYRRIYLSSTPHWPRESVGTREHQGLLDAALLGHARETAQLLARHYLRVGVAMTALIDPSYEPGSMRAAAKLMQAPADPSSDGKAS
jgi:DNA-binding GntR family transcriptional regulator